MAGWRLAVACACINGVYSVVIYSEVMVYRGVMLYRGVVIYSEVMVYRGVVVISMQTYLDSSCSAHSADGSLQIPHPGLRCVVTH